MFSKPSPVFSFLHLTTDLSLLHKQDQCHHHHHRDLSMLVLWNCGKLHRMSDFSWTWPVHLRSQAWNWLDMALLGVNELMHSQSDGTTLPILRATSDNIQITIVDLDTNGTASTTMYHVVEHRFPSFIDSSPSGQLKPHVDKVWLAHCCCCRHSTQDHNQRPRTELDFRPPP